MTTSTLSYAPTAAPSTTRPPANGFWRAPFAAATYREAGYALGSLPIAILGFVFAVTMFSLGLGLAVTVLGLPVLAAALAGARGLGVAERRRARARLGVEATEPPALRKPPNAGWWAGMQARLSDAVGWRALLFQVVMFPARIATFCLTLSFLLTGWVVTLYPAYAWVFPRYVDWPGYRLYDFTSDGERHSFYFDAPHEIAGASLIGLVIVFLTPQLIRALTSIDRGAVRALLR